VNGVARSRDFEHWYVGEHARLFASLLVLAGDRDLAVDAADEALSRALQHWDRVCEMDSPEAWTYTVAVNVIRRAARRRALERRLLWRLASREVMPAPGGEVWDLVRSLPDRQRTAMVLRYIADLPEAEIASVMGVTRGTIASTLADARHALAEVLAEPDVAEESRHEPL
jgi:DNA-directed RNA polymerase specialized sigma24 family protein